MNKKVDHASSPRPLLPHFFSLTIPKRQYKKEKKKQQKQVTKSFPSWKQAHVGMEASKTNQTRWEPMTPQHFHTIPTSCAILPTMHTHKTLYMHLAYPYALNEQGTRYSALLTPVLHIKDDP